MARFHSVVAGGVYRHPPRIAPSEPWLAPLTAPAPLGQGQVFSVTVTDGLYLLDYLIKQHLHQDRDFIFVQDSSVRTEELRQQDVLSLNDVVRRTQEHVHRDGLFLLDYLMKTEIHIVRDSIYLYDTVVASVGAQIFTVLATDYLLLGDVSRRTQERLLRDGLMLDDFSTRVHQKLLRDGLFLTDALVQSIGRFVMVTDGLYLHDVFSRQVVLTAQDQLLIGDLSQRVQEKLLRDGLVLDDTAQALLISVITNAIVWVRLQVQEVLGANAVQNTDLLGTRLYKPDLLGVTVGSTKPRLH